MLTTLIEIVTRKSTAKCEYDDCGERTHLRLRMLDEEAKVITKDGKRAWPICETHADYLWQLGE